MPPSKDPLHRPHSSQTPPIPTPTAPRPPPPPPLSLPSPIIPARAPLRSELRRAAAAAAAAQQISVGGDETDGKEPGAGDVFRIQARPALIPPPLPPCCRLPFARRLGAAPPAAAHESAPDRGPARRDIRYQARPGRDPDLGPVPAAHASAGTSAGWGGLPAKERRTPASLRHGDVMGRVMRDVTV